MKLDFFTRAKFRKISLFSDIYVRKTTLLTSHVSCMIFSPSMRILFMVELNVLFLSVAVLIYNILLLRVLMATGYHPNHLKSCTNEAYAI